MLASRNIRCASRAPLRRTFATTSRLSLLPSTRCQDILPDVEFKTGALDSLAGKDWGKKAKNIESDLRKLTLELRKLYRKSHDLRVVIESSRNHVMTQNVWDTPKYSTYDDVEIDLSDVKVAGKKIPNIWLRDNCQCSACVHESTKQRLLDTFSITQDVHVKDYNVSKKNDLTIQWNDGHQSTYSRAFLVRAAFPEEYKGPFRQAWKKPVLWGASIALEIDTIRGPSVKFGSKYYSMKSLLARIREYGFCYVTNVPHESPSDTEQLLKSIAFIRETHYGGFYDFTADLASKDTAYTNIALEAHTDTTYFSDPAGLQAFHLLSHTDGEGGASLLVDGFKVAQELYDTDREAYRVLSTVNVHAHASGNEGISIQAYRGFPVLEHDGATGALLRVRWNTADRASIELPIEETGRWYDAARKFDGLLKKKENEYWEQLMPGKVLIFDNWRVLHGRSSFTGKRRICGGYVNRDDWISRYKMEILGREEVLGGLA
ncbi:hypothetical protein HBH70_062270 [Parastagonospora nodorum]|nr:hypothetical protein HBH51_051160 [Parastagonospora nodorum]KAH4176627.1 hypothetical protein HBH43_061440 [Parastagonospora nodorum]KAH4202399.1 hypothetical protein HBH42_017830 [Parastagonospora nodorum]KAH4268119.1 hypothetical protein HBI03_060070 [Parastagonospora nodorum]KAH4279215.1 hypothetical protein HBI04_075520 [Parastagonospora nodorum]